MKNYILLFAGSTVFISHSVLATDTAKFPELLPTDFTTSQFKTLYSVEKINPTSQGGRTYHWSSSDAFDIPYPFKIVQVSRTSNALDAHLCISYQVTLDDDYQNLTKIQLSNIADNTMLPLTQKEAKSIAQSLYSKISGLNIQITDKNQRTWTPALRAPTSFWEQKDKLDEFLNSLKLPTSVSVTALSPEKKKEKGADMCSITAIYQSTGSTCLTLTTYIPIKDL
jgi:dUTPase